MKRFYTLKLSILVALLSGFNLTLSAQTVTSFSFTTGVVQYYTVPAGCTLISIDAVGARGGGSLYSNGGAGGRVQCEMVVTSGEILSVYVGRVGSGTGANTGTFGSNGTGYVGGNGSSDGGGGGGCSEVQYGGSRLVVAGAGGGGSWDCTTDHGGLGGNAVGSNGLQCGSYNSSYCGAGGSQTAGGAGGTSGGSAGSYGNGGNGYNGCLSWEGGGGAGYYGGGGGAIEGSGGGGSSYPVTNGGIYSMVIPTQGFNNSNTGSYINIQALIPTIIDSPSTTLAFGGVVVGSSSSPLEFWIGGAGLIPGSGTLTVTPPVGFSVSTSTSGFSTMPISVTYSSATFPAAGIPIYVEFAPTAYSTYSSSVTVTGGGASPSSVAVTGTGIAGCTGTPSPGTASVSPSTGTSGPFTLSLSPVATVGGLNYQWYVFNSGGTGGFVAIPGATTASYTYTPATFTANLYFECVVTCASSGLSATTNIAVATYASGTACAGTPSPGTLFASATSGCSPSFSPAVYIDGSSTTSGITYSYQTSTVSATTGYTAVSGATSPVYTPSVTTTIWIEGIVTCSNSSVSRTTPAVKLTLNPTPSPIAGSNIICLGTPSLFTSAPTGGTWSSGNTSIVNIGLVTGVATGVTPGVASISYTLPVTGCVSTTTVGVNPGVAAISGPSAACVAFPTTFSDLTAGGMWSSSNTATATIGTGTGVLTGVTAGTLNITYTLPSGCFASLPVTINPPPAPITGTFSACVGQTSVLSDITPGGTWSSIDAFDASVGASSGIVSGVAPGTTNIRYILPTGCRSIQSFTVNPLPAAITAPVTGPVIICAGATVALTDGPGTWSSSNTSLATVNPSTGVVTGIAGGAPVISYFAPVTGCYVTIPVNVNPVPAAHTVTVSGGGGYCAGGAGVYVGLNGSAAGNTYYLNYDSAMHIDSLPGSSSSLEFGLFSGIGTYSVTAINSYGCTASMTGSATVFINASPAIDTVTGGGTFCSGSAGVDVLLNTSTVGVEYELYYGGVPVPGGIVNGTGSGINFGPQNETTFLPYTVEAQNILTLCPSMMYGDAFVYPSANPTIYTLNTGGSYCAGSTGVDVYLSYSDGGIRYKLYRDGILDSSLYGVGSLLDFGPQADSGTYTVTATDITNNCTDNMTGTATVAINPLPQPYAVTGGGSYCTGSAGRHVGLDYSVNGTNYSLYNATYGFIDSVAGSTSGLNFGVQTDPGVYFVVADISATGCADTMTGTAIITENAPPNIYNVIASGTGHYCLGGIGDSVYLDGSDLGANFKYQLYLNGTPVGAEHTGTGSSISFGHQTGMGNYTIVAENTATLCTSNMNGPAVVTIDSLPHVYTVSGGGNYCSGGTGVNIILSNSDIGITYQLNGGGTTSSASGVGGMLIFPPSTSSGVYTVLATNGTCQSNMSGSASVGINPLPAQDSVTGGGGYCVGGAGSLVGLSGSNSGVSYQLYNAAGTAGSPLSGTGAALNFGRQTTTGAYLVVATNTLTSCSDTMLNMQTIVIHSVPNLYTVTGGGPFCAGDTGVHVGLSSSDSSDMGITYHLYNGTMLVSSKTGTDSAIDFGLQSVGGTYTVVAASSFGCTTTMASTALVTANPLPTVYNVTGGGNFCVGDTGVHIFLSGSNTYVNYLVFNGADTIGSFWAGTGMPLDLGLDTLAGTYHVEAINVTTLCSSNMTGSPVIVVNPTVMPAVSISSGSFATVCAGSTASFTAMGTNGGPSPVYQWKVNGAISGLGSSFGYMPTDGDVVSVTLTSDASCASPSTAISSTTMVVQPTGAATISVTANTNNQCPGVAVTFSASATFAGMAPLYSWKVNGVSAGVSSSVFAFTPSADSSEVFATLTSNYPCLTTSMPAISNDILVTVNAPVTPVFNIIVNPPTTLTYGESATLSAMVSNAGTSTFTYQWKVNGNAVSGATGPTFTSSTLNNNDDVCAVVTGENTCGASAPVTQCETMVIYGASGVAQVGSKAGNMQVAPNPNKGAFVVKGLLNNTTAGDQDVTLEVTDVLGQVVYTTKIVAHDGVINTEVQLNGGLANGMYLLNVHSGTETSVFHFVVEQ